LKVCLGKRNSSRGRQKTGNSAHENGALEGKFRLGCVF
jgi:hypothetical protein